MIYAKIEPKIYVLGSENDPEEGFSVEIYGDLKLRSSIERDYDDAIDYAIKFTGEAVEKWVCLEFLSKHNFIPVSETFFYKP